MNSYFCLVLMGKISVSQLCRYVMAAFFSDRDTTRHHLINSNPALRFRYIEALASYSYAGQALRLKARYLIYQFLSPSLFCESCKHLVSTFKKLTISIKRNLNFIRFRLNELRTTFFKFHSFLFIEHMSIDLMTKAYGVKEILSDK